MTGRMEFLSFITRDMLRAAPDARFVFGDNLLRRGLGGQAGEMRGEPNAIGVATKRRPDRKDDAYFSDDNPADYAALEDDLAKVEYDLFSGRKVYIPKAGIGTGLSEMPARSPKLYRYLNQRLAEMALDELPWMKS